MDENITRKIDRVLVLAMNTLFELHQRKKADVYGGAVRQEVRAGRSLRTRIDLTRVWPLTGYAVASKKISSFNDVCGHAAVQDAQRNLRTIDQPR